MHHYDFKELVRTCPSPSLTAICGTEGACEFFFFKTRILQGVASAGFSALKSRPIVLKSSVL